jgi:putative ABC transport system permease protein
MESILQDLRFALRIFRKSPGFTAVAVLTLALGIGANTAMLSALYGLVLRPLPYKDSSRLVMLWESNRKVGTKHTPVTGSAYPILRSQAKSFEDMAGFVPGIPRNHIFAERLWGTEERVSAVAATSQLFSVLRVAPILGRAFIPSDEVDTSSAEGSQTLHVAILSCAFWRQHYGASRDVIGNTLSLNRFGIRREYTIVGVMPEHFDFPSPLYADKPDLWTNDQMWTGAFSSENGLYVLGRLRPGANLTQAQAEVNTIADRIRAKYPKYYKDEDVSIVSLSSELIHNVRSMLWVLLAAFAFILLIACANVGNLLLVRAVSREKEMAIRATLGASRLVLIRQMLAEGMLLALGGGALGLLLAYGSLRAFVALLPQSIYIPRLDSVALDRRALAFAALLSVLSAGVFSVLPSLRLARPNLNETMKSGNASKSSLGRSIFRRPGSALLVVEVSLALVLLTGAVLMLRSMQKLLAVNSQFQPEHLLSIRVGMDTPYIRAQQSDDGIRIPFEQFEQRIEAMPGVEAVALSDSFPPPPHGHTWQQFKAAGGGGRIAEEFQPADMQVVTPGYFDMMRMALVRGRWLADADRDGTLPVAVINEAMAKAYWPNRDAFGLKVHPMYRSTEKDVWYTVVGVVREPKRFATGDTPDPAVYVAYAQAPWAGGAVVVRTAGDPKDIGAAMRSIASRMVPGHMVVGPLRTGDELISESSATPRFATQLLTAFSGLAVLLAIVGIYGLISYYTSRRTHEIGIRMAVGAQRTDVILLVLKEGMLLAGLGIAIGILAALAFARSLASLLYGMPTADFLSFAGAAALLAIVAMVACWLPARRAMRIAPIEALRYE